jgi:hypothetical protein
MLPNLGSTSQRICRLLASACLRVTSLHNAEAGIATLSLVIITVAGTTTAVATATVASSDFSFDDLDALVHQSVDRVGASLEVRGSVIARADAAGAQVETLQLTLGVFGQGNPVSLDPTAPADQRLVLTYTNATTYAVDLPYSAQIIGGNGDDLLDPGEMALLTIDVSALPAQDGGAPLTGGERWTLQLLSPVGGVFEISRTLPPILQPVMDLH